MHEGESMNPGLMSFMSLQSREYRKDDEELKRQEEELRELEEEY